MSRVHSPRPPFARVASRQISRVAERVNETTKIRLFDDKPCDTTTHATSHIQRIAVGIFVLWPWKRNRASRRITFLTAVYHGNNVRACQNLLIRPAHTSHGRTTNQLGHLQHTGHFCKHRRTQMRHQAQTLALPTRLQQGPFTQRRG